MAFNPMVCSSSLYLPRYGFIFDIFHLLIEIFSHVRAWEYFSACSLVFARATSVAFNFLSGHECRNLHVHETPRFLPLASNFLCNNCLSSMILLKLVPLLTQLIFSIMLSNFAHLLNLISLSICCFNLAISARCRSFECVSAMYNFSSFFFNFAAFPLAVTCSSQVI